MLVSNLFIDGNWHIDTSSLAKALKSADSLTKTVVVQYQTKPACVIFKKIPKYLEDVLAKRFELDDYRRGHR